eukprot:997125-Amphidinium_carterae.1
MTPDLLSHTSSKLRSRKTSQPCRIKGINMYGASSRQESYRLDHDAYEAACRAGAQVIVTDLLDDLLTDS